MASVNEVRQEVAGKERAMGQFDSAEAQAERQRALMEKQLTDTENDRKILQEKMK